MHHAAKTAAVLLLTAVLSQTAWAEKLDKNDEGTYVLLDTKQQPTPMQMRYYRQNGQWLMDGKNGDEDWQSVCNGQGRCKLVQSAAADLKRWRAMLPENLRQEPLACINNTAFAFCRQHKRDNPQMRLYWWIAKADGKEYLLGANRIR